MRLLLVLSLCSLISLGKSSGLSSPKSNNEPTGPSRLQDAIDKRYREDSSYPLLPTTYAYPIKRVNVATGVQSLYGVRIKGVLVKPLKPRAFLSLVLRVIGWKFDLNEEGRQSFWNKLKLMLAGPAFREQVKQVIFKLGAKVDDLAQGLLRKLLKIGTDGSFFSGMLRLPSEVKPYQFVNYRVAYTDNGQEKWVEGAAQVIPNDPKAWTVVSDIDDTIRWTGVLSTSVMFRTTFLEPFRLIPKMDKVFEHFNQQLTNGTRKVAFHYLSGSPIALLEPLQEFFKNSKLPRGSMHLQEATINTPQAAKRLSQVMEHKLEVFKRLLVDFPSRRLVLIGDSGQADPRTYAQVYRWVVENDISDTLPCIYIRAVSGVDAEKEKDLNSKIRFRWDFREVRADRWMVYTDPAELLKVNPQSGSCYPPGKTNPWVERGMKITTPVTDAQGRYIAWNEVSDEAVANEWQYVHEKVWPLLAP